MGKYTIHTMNTMMPLRMALIAACLPLAHASNFVKIMVHSGCFGKFTGAQPRWFLFRYFSDTRFAFPGIMLQRANFPKAGSDVREYIPGPNTEYADTRDGFTLSNFSKTSSHTKPLKFVEAGSSEHYNSFKQACKDWMERRPDWRFPALMKKDRRRLSFQWLAPRAAN